jgi:hypothetical protein
MYDGMFGESYSHQGYCTDDEYDDLDLDVDGMDNEGDFHTGYLANEYGDLCQCNSNNS